MNITLRRAGQDRKFMQTIKHRKVAHLGHVFRHERQASAWNGSVGHQRLPFAFDPSDWHYDMSGPKYMHIFNNFEFKDTQYFPYGKPSTLLGTEFDMQLLRKVFSKLDFEVKEHHNKDYAEILDIVSKLSRKDHRDTSCVCLAILTHGGEDDLVAAADQPYKLSSLLGIMQHGDDGLVGKPKILLAQACRGNKYDTGRVQLDNCSPRSTVLPTHADTLIIYSSVRGYLSWGHMDGSWLFKELCHVLDGAHAELDLLQMTTVLAGLIARKYETYVDGRPELGKVKQMPEIHSTLTKLLRFCDKSKKKKTF